MPAYLAAVFFSFPDTFLLAYPKKDNNLFEPYLRVNWSSCLLVLSQFLSRVVYGMSDLSSLQINHSLVELSIADRVVLQ